uniref:Uncharacterized protein n=1 Tax=Cacopsylla melanoneura TaxID=428564 RepID=A0A8D8VTP3_9HEMI
MQTALLCIIYLFGMCFPSFVLIWISISSSPIDSFPILKLAKIVHFYSLISGILLSLHLFPNNSTWCRHYLFNSTSTQISILFSIPFLSNPPQPTLSLHLILISMTNFSTYM